MAKQDSLDPQTRDLVRFAAAIAQGYEPELRERVGPLRSSQVPVPLGRGAAAAKRADGRVSPRPDRLHGLAEIQRRGIARPPIRTRTTDGRGEWTRRGEELCAVVYGENYAEAARERAHAASGH